MQWIHHIFLYICISISRHILKKRVSKKTVYILHFSRYWQIAFEKMAPILNLTRVNDHTTLPTCFLNILFYHLLKIVSLIGFGTSMLFSCHVYMIIGHLHWLFCELLCLSFFKNLNWVVCLSLVIFKNMFIK